MFRPTNTVHIVSLVVLLNCYRISHKLSVVSVCCGLCIGVLSYWPLERGFLPSCKLGLNGSSDRKVVLIFCCSNVIEAEFAGYFDNGLSDTMVG